MKLQELEQKYEELGKEIEKLKNQKKGIWCFMNKFINSGSGYYFLDPRVEIKEVNNDN